MQKMIDARSKECYSLNIDKFSAAQSWYWRKGISQLFL
jgi:hypothetical protein